jgi:hypothetical protein
MRPALRLAASLRPGAARARDPATLTPPLALLRRILRAHRALPAEQRVLGDAYVKEEFRRHREVENPMHIVRSPAPDLVKDVVRLTVFGKGGFLVRVAAVRADGRGVAVARGPDRAGEAG